MTGKGFVAASTRPAAQSGQLGVSLDQHRGRRGKGRRRRGLSERAGQRFYGRGAPANGGGGGNYARAGGGGGGNGDSALAWNGHGVMENNITGAMAGRWTPATPATPTSSPTRPAAGVAAIARPLPIRWRPPRPLERRLGRRSATEVGGRGGRPPSNDPLRQIFMGGGGGAAAKARPPTSSRGGRGGGIVLLFSRDLTGNARIIADGAGGQASASNEGGGGGGAGGTIVVATNRNQSGVTAQAPGWAGRQQRRDVDQQSGGRRWR